MHPPEKAPERRASIASPCSQYLVSSETRITETCITIGRHPTCAGSGRALGYVCAPSLAQHVIARCAHAISDLDVYRKNRDLLYNALTSYGFHCIYPDGAFYLFMKSPEEDAAAFCAKAREKELLLVPADSFGTPGYVRLAYCVSTEQIERSLPAFEELAKWPREKG